MTQANLEDMSIGEFFSDQRARSELARETIQGEINHLRKEGLIAAGIGGVICTALYLSSHAPLPVVFGFKGLVSSYASQIGEKRKKYQALRDLLEYA